VIIKNTPSQPKAYIKYPNENIAYTFEFLNINYAISLGQFEHNGFNPRHI
jgi:hypothetical protein